MDYPQVIGEFDTIRAVAAGMSLSRYGDGELKMCYGVGYSREAGNRRLARELRQILEEPGRRCIVGIPTMDPAGPKYTNWLRHKRRFEGVLAEGVQYYSAFVTRPDSSPWIRTREYAELVQSIWAGKRAVVVCERDGSMLKVVRLAAREVLYVECPRSGAYGFIRDIEKQVRQLNPDVAILAAGPTATCLAHRLSKRRIHSVDLGSAGGFLLELLKA